MAIVINGSGTVTGISVGGLPDGIVDAGTLATNSVDSAELIDGAVDDSHMAAMAASKLTGALPAISAASLTNVPAANITGTLPAISGANLTGITTGKVLQVLNYEGSSRTTFSTNDAWTVLGVTLDITPSATSSKVLALVTQPARVVGSTPIRGSLRLKRDSTTIWNKDSFTEHMHVRNAADEHDTLITFSHLDSPSTTSATTYELQAYLENGTQMILFEGTYGANIILMEIAG